MNGWIPENKLLIYASSITLTISGDVTAIYQKGTKIQLTQTTVKYFVVLSATFSSSTTTVTITGGDDYSLANADILEPSYSYQENPQGFPGEFSFTPSASGETGSVGTYAQDNVFGRFSIKGKLCFFRYYFRITNKGSWSATFFSKLPVTSLSSDSASGGMAGYVCPDGSNPVTASKGVPYYNSNAAQSNLLFVKLVGQNSLGWSDIAVNDWVSAEGYVAI